MLVDLDLDHRDDVDLALVRGDDELVGSRLCVVSLGGDVLVAGKLFALKLLLEHLLLGLVRLCFFTFRHTRLSECAPQNVHLPFFPSCTDHCALFPFHMITHLAHDFLCNSDVVLDFPFGFLCDAFRFIFVFDAAISLSEIVFRCVSSLTN